ncbi:transmembrane protein 126A isoform X2 [Ranitomeya imitator]|uniref:transmembrane protein 126A isoform X2 n=1 Tax=Ranitomeya imitator TaxID=111125 RepID=UPI0037E8D5E8
MGHPESPQSEFSKFLDVRLSELPAVDRKYFKYGSLLIGLSAATSGFLSSQVFRQTMKVRRGFLISSFIVTSLPLFQTTFIYQLAIPNTIMSGRMNCSLCNTIRGTCIGAIVGGLGSASLAAFLSTAYFLNLRMFCFTSIESSFDRMLSAHSNSFQMQNHTPGIHP